MRHKLNICVVHPNRSAFSETFIRNHIKFLPANVFALYGGWFPAFDKNDCRIADTYIKRSVASRSVAALCKFLPAGLVNKIDSKIKGYPFDEALNEAAFESFLCNNKIDVVLAEFMLKGVIVRNVCDSLKIPLVVHTHGGGDIMSNPDFDLYSNLFADLFLKASGIISVDNYSSLRLLEMGLEKNKLHEVKYGIDLDLFSPTVPSSNGPVFFAVGRLVNKKAPYLTILAFAKVLQRHPNAQLIIGGNGDLYDCCIQVTKALDIEKNILFKDILTPEEVSHYMCQSRAFVQHSIHTTNRDSEGTPVAVLEAMASGLPVISTDHNGIAEVISHGEEGLLVKENDIDLMAQFMIQMIENPALADELGRRARSKIEMNFEMTKVIGNLYDVLYEAFLKGSKV